MALLYNGPVIRSVMMIMTNRMIGVGGYASQENPSHWVDIERRSESTDAVGDSLVMNMGTD